MRSKSISRPLSERPAQSMQMPLAVGPASWEIGVHRHAPLRGSRVSFPSLWSKQAHYRQDTNPGPWRKLAAKPPWLIATFNGHTSGVGTTYTGRHFIRTSPEKRGELALVGLVESSSCSQSITGSKGERGEGNKDEDTRSTGRCLVEEENWRKSSDGEAWGSVLELTGQPEHML